MKSQEVIIELNNIIGELKPCPFCGGKAKFWISEHENSDTTQTHSILCEDVFGCGARINESLSGWSCHYEDQVKTLVNRWNRSAK